MHLWEDQSSRIKSSPNQTAKWMSGMVKNSHELVSIMGKMYELDMFDILGSKAFKLVDAPPKDESASQPEENSFYALNLTDDNHNIDELAINTSESTRKKKKAKVDFIIDPNKASKSTVDNNEPPKAKVFKNPPKLEPPEIIQKSGPYSVVPNSEKTFANL
ncbi:hypothetical protein G9A89_005564 [Geosiphon pyriformis]|nr:hypothetical protein G9A89_005564 [Geosiphon pyriformis]